MNTTTAANHNSRANEILERIASGDRLSVSGLASEYSIAPGKMRAMLTQHFGSRIQFRRGRNGGISITK
jgi:hypothetical protein